MNLQPNTLLFGGRYRIITQIAQGGFGITYRAEQTNLGRSVCIKEFFFRNLCERQGDTNHVTATQSGSELVASFRKKFEKEARRVASFDHPNIVKVLDIFEENGTAYIVMDFVEGETLQQMVTRKGRLSEAEALAYILPICDALTTIHAGGLLHLDVKPSNILVNRVDNRPVLIDFGTSKFVETDEVHHTTTAPLALSKGYAPMEQYGQDVSKLSPATDVYGVGATLYKCLTGLTPPEPMEQLTDGLKRPKSLNSAVSKSVSRATVAAMALKAGERPQEAALLKQQLLVLPSTMSSHPVEVELTEIYPEPELEPPATPTVEPLRAKTSNKPLWIVGIVLLLLVGGATRFLNQGNTAEPSVVDEVPNQVQAQLSPVIQNLLNNMVYVEGGTFTMGVQSGETSTESNERPAHRVTLSSYRLGKYEVTQEEWLEVMNTIPSHFQGDNLPVEQVSWDDCQAFIRKLNAMTGKRFALPTEAQWEFAARGGTKSKGYTYAGSSSLDDVAWNWGNSSSKTHPVGTKQPNELGLYDMSGNVREWCSDWYGAYSSEAQTNPTGPASGSYRVLRGGSWYSFPRFCRASNRDDGTPDFRDDVIGLRLVLLP